MSFELKHGINFPPDDIELDKILLGFSEYFINGEYTEGDILTFLKEGSGLYSQESECIGLDDSNLGSHQKDRIDIIKKYIQTISFLGKKEDDSKIRRQIESIFEDIGGIDIQKEIETGRNQELADLGKATKKVVFNLVDAKSLLDNSEVLEFDTPKEIFFFVLNLLGLEKIAAYLNGYGERVLKYRVEPEEKNAINLCISRINNNSELVNYAKSQGIYDANISISYGKLLFNIDDLQKIQLKQKESN